MKPKDKSQKQLLKEIDQLKSKIAELKNSETERNLSEVILDNLPVGYNLFDMEGKVISVNSMARKYFGVSEDDPLTDYCFFDDPSISEDTKWKVRNGKVAIEERYIDFHTNK